ncbi:MAG: hypothetical protein U0L37_05195 [Bacteroidales bacterium]|nr:hypothetical protein [Bacteroidales bacterium]
MLKSKNTGNNIETLARFLYLNTYAFLLLFIGVGIGVLPLFEISRWLLIPQIGIVVICLKGTYSIFSSWEDKKRKYHILIERNSKEFREDTFSEYMEAPCGRLLTKTVLKDLNQSDKYRILKINQKSYFAQLEKTCRRTKVKVYTSKDYEIEKQVRKQ